MAPPNRQRARRSGTKPDRFRWPACGRVLLWLERLEDRTLLSAGGSLPSAIALSFADTATTYQVANATEYLASPSSVALNRISLNARDLVTASVNTAPYGGGLDSYLRVFQQLGTGVVRQIASNDNYQGKDAGLTFQAPATGTYYVGVSSFDNTAYDPLTAAGGSGSSKGMFDLHLAKASGGISLGLTGASFKVSQTTGVAGDPVTINYTIENRGWQDAAPASVSLVVSADNRFDDGLPAVASNPVPIALAAGASATGSFAITLGAQGTSLASFSSDQIIFLGLRIGSAMPDGPEQGNDWAPVQVIASETIAPGASNTTLDTAQSIVLNSRTSTGTLRGGDEVFFKFVLTQSGNLHGSVNATGGAASLTLYDAQGNSIAQSDGQAINSSNPLITQGLTQIPQGVGTTYYLKVANLDKQAISYTLTTLFTPSISTLQTISMGAGDLVVVAGDFNGDGRVDLVTANVQNVDFTQADNVNVFLGNGDGTFQSAGPPIDVGMAPTAMIAADFDGTGRLDLAVLGDKGLRILLGNGDGTFQNSTTMASAPGNSLVAGDFNGNGHCDLAVGDSSSNTIRILQGIGDGTFQLSQSLTVSGTPNALAAADFRDNGYLDLAVADRASNQVTLLQNQGGGLFQEGPSFSVGIGPVALAVGDFNGDGEVDVAVANNQSGNVTVLRGDDHGSFQTPLTFSGGNHPTSLVTGDFNGDGHLDLATGNSSSNDATVFLGEGDATFKSTGSFAVAANPLSLVAGDFNGDGRVDLAAADYAAKEVSVLLGFGDGSFTHVGLPNTTGQHPSALVSGDFNGDGRLDLAIANTYSGTVTILLGQGDGTFQTAGTFGAGQSPVAIVAGDFNGDGRLDLAIANSLSDDVTILLGNGDGTFQHGESYHVGGRPSALVAGDFNEDGQLDLAVAIKFNGDLSMGNEIQLLLGNGDGTFANGGSFRTGSEPVALVAGDFNGDHHLDLATGNYYSQDVSVLLGNGHGSFQSPVSYAVTGFPVSLVAGSFDGDNRLDLAVATKYASTVVVLLNDGAGAFHPGSFVTLSTRIKALVAGDFSGDGNLALVAASDVYTYSYTSANSVNVLLSNGLGGFQNAGSFSAGTNPSALVAGDFNGDGRLDLAIADYGSSEVTILLGTGTGSFVSPVLAPSLVESTPLIANFTGGSAPDAVVLTQTGQIIVRRGMGNEPGSFAPPVVINPDPQLAARGLALVQFADVQPILAALDANTFSESRNTPAPRVPRVTLYESDPDGTFSILTSVDLPPGFLPANIASGDLDGNGLGDLVISAAASDQILVSLQTVPGVFGPVTAYDVGVNPSAINLADMNDNKLPDIVVTDRLSGQVSVLKNQGNGVFGQEERFRAGAGLYGLTTVNGASAVQSLEGTDGVVAGTFSVGTGTDLVAINGGTDSFTVLLGSGLGGYLNPQPGLINYLGASPTAIVSGHFITGDSNLDLAILSKNSATISIYRGDGRGDFTLISMVSAGNQPTGLALADVSRPGGGGPDGIQDLLVGNAFGDLLILTGTGNGTFSEYRRADQNVSLAVANSPTPGQKTFFFSDQGSDQLAFQPAPEGTAAVTGPKVYQDRSSGINAPGPETVVSVAGTQYLVVVNSGANVVLIYTLGQDGLPDPASKQTYFTGTDPVSVTVTTPADDLNRDSIPDLVIANQGSNDVSVFLGQMTGTTWTLAYRPRQSSGGFGPTSVAIADVTGVDAQGAPVDNPELLVSNGQSNNVAVLASRGDGFFVNQGFSFLVGSDPQQILVGNFAGPGGLDVVTINTGSNDVTLIADFATDPVISTISSGDTLPVAAITLDLKGSATTDLLVANAGNGVLELFQDGPDGFAAVKSFFQADTPHLSDLALVTAGDDLLVYGTNPGSEAAVLLATFISLPPPPPPIPPSPGFESGVEINDASAIVSPASVVPLPVPEQASTTPEEGGNNLTTTTVAASRGSAELDAGDAAPRMRGAALRILLLNLTDQETREEDVGARDNEATIDPSQDLGDKADTQGEELTGIPMEAPTTSASPLDRYWQTVGAELSRDIAEVPQEEFLPENRPAEAEDAACLAAAAALTGFWQACDWASLLPDECSHGGGQYSISKKIVRTLCGD